MAKMCIRDRCRAFFSIDYGYRFYTRCLSEAVIGKSFIYEFPGQVVFVGIELQGLSLIHILFTEGSLNTFAKPTNVDTSSRILCYDIRDLGKQLQPVGMLVVLDSCLLYTSACRIF